MALGVLAPGGKATSLADSKTAAISPALVFGHFAAAHRLSAPTPAWEDYTQEETGRIKGGRRWRVTLAAGESKKIFWTYSLKIDAKNEVVGGNRRE